MISINLAIYFLISNLIDIDFEKISDSQELQRVIELKLIFIFLSTSIVYILIGYKIISEVVKDILELDNYLEKHSNYRFLKDKIDLSRSLEFRKIGRRLAKIVMRSEKLRKKKLKFNTKLKVINYQQEKLLGAISHELKNPMSSILGYSQILKDEFSGMQVKPIYISFLDKIISNGKRVDELLDRLRLAVQLDNNKFELKYRVFQLENSVKEIVDNIKESKKLNRNFKIEIEFYELYADKTLIELVIINLIENAIKYSDGDIIIKMEESSLKIIDYGIGIEETELTSVTKRFYRVNRDTHQQSIGLGLAIVTYILKLHNLKMEIESRVGSGSVFSVNLSGIKNRILPK